MWCWERVYLMARDEMKILLSHAPRGVPHCSLPGNGRRNPHALTTHLQSSPWAPMTATTAIAYFPSPLLVLSDLSICYSTLCASQVSNISGTTVLPAGTGIGPACIRNIAYWRHQIG